MKRVLLQIFATTWRFLLVIAVLIVAGLVYFHYELKTPSTNDGQIYARVIPIATHMSGIVESVAVENNQRVKQGQVLFTLENGYYQIQLQQTKAALDEAAQAVNVATAEVEVAEAKVASQQSAFHLSSATSARIKKLYENKVASQESFERANNVNAQNQIQLAEQQSLLAEKKADLSSEKAKLKSAMAALNNAKLQLSFTTITAPVDGIVSNFYLHAGAPVSAYQPVFGIINPQPTWVIANFLESELDNIKPGQKADIRLLMYPDHVFSWQR